MKRARSTYAYSSRLGQKATGSRQSAYVRKSTSENFRDSYGYQLMKNDAYEMQRCIAKILG